MDFETVFSLVAFHIDSPAHFHKVLSISWCAAAFNRILALLQEFVRIG